MRCDVGGKAGKKRIVLSMHVARVNAGIGAAALVPGMHLPACVRSVEDHGFLLTTGVQVRLCTCTHGQFGGFPM